MAGILDAAEALLNDVGIDATGTTAIAARAGASVGSLYYFFPGKDAILQALAERFAAMSGAMMAAAIHDVGHGPLGRVVPHLAALIEARPAFCVVFDACGRCECASGAFLPLHEACIGQMCDLLAARLPGLPATQRRHAAALVVSVLVGVLKELHAIPGRSRARMLRELQSMVARYVAAYLPVHGSTDLAVPVPEADQGLPGETRKRFPVASDSGVHAPEPPACCDRAIRTASATRPGSAVDHPDLT